MNRNQLHQYQNTIVGEIYNKSRCFVIVGLGLGKTISTLTAIQDLHDSFQIKRVLIIAPLRVAQNVWRQEALQWTHVNVSISLCLGSVVERIKAIRSDSVITVINRENVPWLIENHKWTWDMLIIDESTSFKSPSAKRFKALNKVCAKVDRIVLLTATPSPKGMQDLWAQTYLLDAGESLERTYSAFKLKYIIEGKYGYKNALRPGAEKLIKDRIRKYCIVMKTEDYLMLPKKIETDVRINLDEKTLKIYNNFAKKFIMSVNESEINAANAAVLAGKLQQLAQGAIYDTDSEICQIHDMKLNALEELVDSAGDESVLIAYAYRHDLSRMKKLYPEAVDLRDPGAIERWNKGEVKIMCCHPASAGHGLNLQTGGHILIFFGLTWSAELYAQMIGRLYRQGQTRPVIVQRMIVANTIDERIIAVLEDRHNNQEALIDAMRQIRRIYEE
jgi:SNF2 family DNA or RNA helicase